MTVHAKVKQPALLMGGSETSPPNIPYTDLRGWIEEARKLGEIREVKGLSWEEEISMAAEVVPQSAIGAEAEKRPGTPRLSIPRLERPARA